PSWETVLIAPWQKVANLSWQIMAAVGAIFVHPDQLSGLIGIVSAGKDVVGSGWLSALRFAVLLNVNLAIFNLLPLAPLDGGKILCCLLEKLTPRPAQIHNAFSMVGLAVILLLLVYTTVLDVVRQLA